MAVSPAGVRIETIEGWSALQSPYRGLSIRRALLRLTVSIERRGHDPYDVTIDVDDAAVEVSDQRRCFAISAIDALFVVERQPPAWRFLTWFGVFARHLGLPDRLLLETPDRCVARFVERAIEKRLGLRDEPVRGELRIA